MAEFSSADNRGHNARRYTRPTLRHLGASDAEGKNTFATETTLAGTLGPS